MNADRWRQIDKVLQAALDLGPDQRAAFLDRARGSAHDSVFEHSFCDIAVGPCAQQSRSSAIDRQA